jgi:hypothetical protein
MLLLQVRKTGNLPVTNIPEWVLNYTTNFQAVRYFLKVGSWVNGQQDVWPIWPHLPSSAHSKEPSAAQPKRLSRYGHLKAEVIYQLYS